MKKSDSAIYEGCACTTDLCKGECRVLHIEDCPSLYHFKWIQRTNKEGKLINKWSQVEVG